MRTALGIYLELAETGRPTGDWLDAIPAWQIRVSFEDFYPQCPDRIPMPVERRPANALNIEIGEPLPRCRSQRPDHWPVEASALRWIGSGGSPLIFGVCGVRTCPRAREPRHGS